MEDQHDKELPPLPPDVRLELERMMLDGSIKGITAIGTRLAVRVNFTPSAR